MLSVRLRDPGDIGSVQPDVVECPSCGAAYVAAEECLDIPTCPACAAPNTWEARRGPAFRQLIAEIDGCPSLAELARLGKRLYALALPHDQAGVAWTRYRLRRAGLEAALTLRAEARSLIAEVEHASERELPRLGTRLYRLHHGGVAAAITPVEWRRVWQAYQARKASAFLTSFAASGHTARRAARQDERHSLLTRATLASGLKATQL